MGEKDVDLGQGSARGAFARSPADSGLKRDGFARAAGGARRD